MRHILLTVLLVSLCWPQDYIYIKRRAAAAGGGGGGTATYTGSASGYAASAVPSLPTSTSLTIAGGDIIVVTAWGAAPPATAVACGANSLTLAKTITYASYQGTLWYKLNATAGTTTCTATYGTADAPFATIIAANWAPSLPASVTLIGSSCVDAGCSTLSATTANRTAQNVTQAAARALQVAMGVDWDGGVTHTGANSYTNRLSGGVSTTSFIYDKVVTSSGSYPGGNYGTVSPTDEYLGFFVVFGLGD